MGSSCVSRSNKYSHHHPKGESHQTQSQSKPPSQQNMLPLSMISSFQVISQINQTTLLIRKVTPTITGSEFYQPPLPPLQILKLYRRDHLHIKSLSDSVYLSLATSIEEDSKIQQSLVRHNPLYFTQVTNFIESSINQQDTLGVCFEYYPNTLNLQECPSSLYSTKKLLKQAFAGLAYLDKQTNIFHGNLHFGNILLFPQTSIGDDNDEDESFKFRMKKKNSPKIKVKITDFALNRISVQYNIIYTRNSAFHAPELREVTHQQELQEQMTMMTTQSKQADRWSSGVYLAYIALLTTYKSSSSQQIPYISNASPPFNNDQKTNGTADTTQSNYSKEIYSTVVAEQFMNYLEKKEYQAAIDLLKYQCDEIGIILSQLIDVNPDKRPSLASIETEFTSAVKKMYLFEVKDKQDFDQLRQTKNISKDYTKYSSIIVELQSLCLGSELIDTLLNVLPYFNQAKIKKAFFKLQKNNIRNKNALKFSSLLTSAAFSSLVDLKINLGLNGITGFNGGKIIKRILRRLQAPVLKFLEVSLSMNDLGDEGSVAVFQSISLLKLPKLEKIELSLGQNGITDVGLHRMAIHFRTLDFMQIKGFSLHLGKNSFTYDAVEAFMLEFRKIVPYISQYSDISFIMNKLSEEDILKLQAKEIIHNPFVKILY